MTTPTMSVSEAVAELSKMGNFGKAVAKASEVASVLANSDQVIYEKQTLIASLAKTLDSKKDAVAALDKEIEELKQESDRVVKAAIQESSQLKAAAVTDIANAHRAAQETVAKMVADARAEIARQKAAAEATTAKATQEAQAAVKAREEAEAALEAAKANLGELLQKLADAKAAAKRLLSEA